MSKDTVLVMSIDLEVDLGANSDTVFLEILPRVLDEFDSRGIRCTFFVVSSLAVRYKDQIHEIVSRGHEIASHSRSHSFLNWENSWTEIKESYDDFSSIGVTVSGFRAPGYITVSSKDHLAMVHSAGYSYDASFAGFLPFRYFRPFLKSQPFEVLLENGKKIIEMPMPRIIWPSGLHGLSYVRLFYPVSFWLLRLFGFRYMFYLHLWEFIDERKLTPFGLFEKLIARGSGDRSWKRFILYLDLAKENKVKWVSCQEYLSLKKLL